MSSENTLVITRTLPASAARIFAAWTTADIIKQWFCPNENMSITAAEIDPRAGGDYRIVMENKEGEIHSPSGTYKTIVANEKLAFTWKWADSELITRVTIELKELGENETELTLTHEGFPDADLSDRHNDGWTGCLDRLQELLNYRRTDTGT
jgi:uncharacterized protein YndB with AHSA1/START domain